MSGRAVAAILSVSLVAACAGVNRRADELATAGRHEEAVRLLEAAVADSPGDPELGRALESARNHALRARLEEVRKARSLGFVDGAAAELELALAEVERWSLRPDATTARALDAEVTGTGNGIRERVEAVLSSGRPFSAATLMRSYPVLDRAAFSQFATGLRSSTQRAGAQRCRALAKDSGGATHWRRLVVAYCEHWGVQLEAPQQLPGTAGAIQLEGAIAGLDAADLADLHRALGEAHSRSPLHRPEAPPWTLKLAGEAQVTTTKSKHQIETVWTERGMRPQTESYQQAYTTTEPRMATRTVPYTTYQSYTYSCGRSTCTGSRPVTQYRTETYTQYQTVTKTRPATRTVMRPYAVAHDFKFDAIEHVGVYLARIDATLVGPDGGALLRLPLTRTSTRTALEHDTTFPLAGITPSTPELPTAGAWFRGEAAAIARELERSLLDQWVARHCRNEAPTREDVARCLFVKGPLLA
ncbi:MAG: hypothetical protein WBV82_07650, partial [Myxococcaceae bacterium]